VAVHNTILQNIWDKQQYISFAQNMAVVPVAMTAAL
jgi:hypothetical protein